MISRQIPNSPPPQLSRRRFLALGTSVAALSALGTLPAQRSARPPNVLILSVDDLRPQMACLGVPWMKTPHLDELASACTVFERAQCQQAVCLPSRISLWSGLRPDTTRITNLQGKFRSTIPQARLLHQTFKQSGYTTVGMGKILHDEKPEEWDEWTDLKKQYLVQDYVSDEALEALGRISAEIPEEGGEGRPRKGKGSALPRWKSSEAVEKPDETYHDGLMTRLAVERLAAHAAGPGTKPLFMALGYKKPHLPFVAPKRYWDLYDRAAIPTAPNPFVPKDMPDIAKTTWGELRAFTDIPKEGDLEEAKARELVHGYAACVSFLDAQIGRLMSELKRLGLWEDTIVVLYGDHGWKLGEHKMWAKHTAFENDTNAPLFIKPAGTRPGRRTRALVEFVDIYPTLLSMAALGKGPENLEGRDLSPLLRNPGTPWAPYAFSQWETLGGKAMGYSVRSDRWRYTEWRRLADGETLGRELYDHEQDPRENVNVAMDPVHAPVLTELHGALLRNFPSMPKS